MEEFLEYDVFEDKVTEEIRTQCFKDAHEFIDKAVGEDIKSDLDFCVLVIGLDKSVGTVGNASIGGLKIMIEALMKRLAQVVRDQEKGL